MRAVQIPPGQVKSKYNGEHIKTVANECFFTQNLLLREIAGYAILPVCGAY